MIILQPLTAEEFEQQLEAGELTLSLVGMSNVGKTYWSKLLVQSGFTHICCDDLIEEKLGDELIQLGYTGGITDMAKWLGQPYDERFAANQQRYLQLEIETMQEIIERVEKGIQKGNIIIDTTGSVVHTGSVIREKLNALTKVIYLEATKEMQQKMFELYIAEPKPVLWADVFKSVGNESNTEALARCYPKLLEYRSGLYAEMAHVTILRETSLAMAGASDFLEYVKGALP